MQARTPAAARTGTGTCAAMDKMGFFGYRCPRVAIWRGHELLAFGDYKAGWADRTGKICYMRLGARNRVRAAVRATKERWV